MQSECQKFGNVLKVVIPRPEKGKHIPGLGKIFVYYDNIESAKKARSELTKKLFDKRIVEGNYLAEEAFLKGNYDIVEVAKE